VTKQISDQLKEQGSEWKVKVTCSLVNVGCLALCILMRLLCSDGSFSCGWRIRCVSWHSRMLCQRSKHHTTV